MSTTTTTTRRQPERFQVTLQAMPSEVPVIIRLRKFQKAALRSYGLRCTSAERLGDKHDFPHVWQPRGNHPADPAFPLGIEGMPSDTESEA